MCPDKCCFAQHSIHYLGYVFDGHGCRPDYDRIRTVLEHPPPTNQRETWQVLGILAYNRMFILKFSHRAAHLYELLKKNTFFEWTERHQQAFDDLKAALLADVILYISLFIYSLMGLAELLVVCHFKKMIRKD